MKVYCYVALSDSSFTGFTLNAMSVDHACDKLWKYFSHSLWDDVESVHVQVKGPEVNYAGGHVTISVDCKRITSGVLIWHTLLETQ